MKKLQKRANIDVGKLTALQKSHLKFGRCLLDCAPGEPFRDEEHRHAVWAQHGEAIMKDYIAKSPGKRPRAWWSYEAPAPLPNGESQAGYLRRLGLLGEDEAGRLTEAAYLPPVRPG